MRQARKEGGHGRYVYSVECVAFVGKRPGTVSSVGRMSSLEAESDRSAITVAGYGLQGVDLRETNCPSGSNLAPGDRAFHGLFQSPPLKKVWIRGNSIMRGTPRSETELHGWIQASSIY
jgi:hypothetical protein